MSQEDVRKEIRSKEWADGARYIHWVGIALLATFLVAFLNILPAKFNDPIWQLNLISQVINGGTGALVGALLICLARLFNFNDRQIQNRAALVRTLASWVAIGWLLLIPLQLFISVRQIKTTFGQEQSQIRSVERVARAVRNASTEEELRAAFALLPNQPPLPKLSVPLEIAKANLLAQFQKTINSAKNRQEQISSDRWQTWIREAFRNSLQCIVLGVGFLAIGKNRLLATGSQAKSSPSRSRSRSRSRA